MKRIFTVVMACLMFTGLFFAQAQKSTNEQVQGNPVNKENQNYVVVPFSFSVFPIIVDGIKTICYAQINIGAGYCDRLQGLSLGFVNITGEDAKGVDCSLVGITGNDFNGLQCSLVTYTGNDFKGAQLALVNYVNGNFSMLQFGHVNIVMGNFNGLQDGLINVNGCNFKGVELGLANFTVNSNSGVQAGLVNYSGYFEGLQLGLVNYSDYADGVPIGLVSIVARNGQTHVQFYADEMGFGNIALINGSRTVYNIYTAGIDYSETYWTYGMGLGIHLPLDPFYVNIEILGSSVSHIDTWDGDDILSKVRVYAGFSLFEHLSLIVGVSLNYYYSCCQSSSAYVPPMYNITRTYNNGGKLWPGIFAGIMF